MAKDKILTEAELRRKYTNSGKADIILPKDNVLRLPSRILPLNYQLGGGIPFGKMMEVFGWESTGKSLLAADFAYVTQYLGGEVLWADMENAWNNSWAETLGLDTSRIELLDGEQSIEVFSDWSKDAIRAARARLPKNAPILLVCDSIAAGDTLENLDGDQKDKKAEMGVRAKAWDRMYRMRINVWKKYGVCVIMINQLRGKLGASMFEAAETTPGGKATAYYASIRLALVKGSQIKGRMTKEGFVEDKTPKGKKLGSAVTFQVKKNKTAPPRDSIKTEVYFNEIKTGYVGYNKYLGLDELALEAGIIKKTGNTYSVGGKVIAKKRDDVLIAIMENKGLRAYLCKKLDINTVSQTEERLSGISKDLFKIGAE